MRKPEKSIKKRKAALKRGAKRNARLKKTQADKHKRLEENRLKKLAEERKFQNHMRNLTGNLGPR